MSGRYPDYLELAVEDASHLCWPIQSCTDSKTCVELVKESCHKAKDLYALEEISNPLARFVAMLVQEELLFCG